MVTYTEVIDDARTDEGVALQTTFSVQSHADVRIGY